MCTARLFSQGVELFALKLYLDRVLPHHPFLASEHQRHWDSRRRRPHLSAFPHFDTILECVRQTDGLTGGQTNGYAIPYDSTLQS